MFRVRRRGTTRTTPLVFLAALMASGLLVPTWAGASSIAITQKQIADLSAALSRQQMRSETTANQYDAEKVTLATINVNIGKLQGMESQKRSAAAVTSKKLAVAVVRAY